MLFESHLVAKVPVPFPTTLTARYFPLCDLITVNVGFVALEIVLQVLGIVAVTALTRAVQAYH